MISLKKLLPYSIIEKAYVNSGFNFANAVNYIFFGECLSFESLLTKWESWEKEYQNRGYRTISIDDFLECLPAKKNIESLLREKIEGNEISVLHSEIYRENFLGKVKPIIDLDHMINGGREIQFGICELPST
ncbi:MAG: hypothetical protein PHT94_00165, partial [Candidatus Nanoarchaeia archaeon]|nr:hypothetical protein [Candidatus Nanoarchaeia archaeon]